MVVSTQSSCECLAKRGDRMPEVVEDLIRITNETQNLAVVREFVTRMVQRSAVDRKVVNKIILAVDEAVSNIIEHAYEEGRSGTIEVQVKSDAQIIEITIRDSGKHFDPDRVEPVRDIGDHVKSGRRHGLGIFIMRQIMDEVQYTYKEGVENELRLVKYIN
jgi:serine/threonine-protein kinase RsbW